jgi:secreted trypsin-like serine protease
MEFFAIFVSESDFPSGSPVFIHVSRGYDVAIAIASFFSGNGCESTDPSGYTKLLPYNDWIRNVTSTS